MAWTDQCKYAFKANADALLFNQKNKKNVTKTLKQLSAESAIPFRTLRRWYYDLKSESCTKNGTDAMPAEGRPICKRCGENPVYLADMKNGKRKPYRRSSKFYGLCQKCMRLQTKIEKIDALANDKNGRLAFCPHCHESFYIHKGETI